MHRYGRHHGIGFDSLPLQSHLLLPAWHDRFPPPPKLPVLSPRVCAVLPAACSCCLSCRFLHTTHDPFGFLLLSVFVWTWSCYVLLLILSCSEMSCCPHSGTRTVSNPLPCFHTHTQTPSEINKPPSLGIFLNCVSTSESKLKDA